LTLLAVTLMGSHLAPQPTVNAGPNQTITLPGSANYFSNSIQSVRGKLEAKLTLCC
jgi:hypothetical protein